MMLHNSRKPAEYGTFQQFNSSRGRMQVPGGTSSGVPPVEEFEELKSYNYQIDRPLLPPQVFSTLQASGAEASA